MTRLIESLVYGRPPSWVSWTGVDDSAAREDLEARGVSGSAMQVALDGYRQCAGQFDAFEGLAGAAVWYPSVETGQVCGTMVSRTLAVEEGMTAERYLADVAAAPKARGLKVFEYDAALAQLAAGPAVVEIEVSARRWSSQVVSQVHWTVIPEGSAEAVYLRLATPYPALFDALTQESNVMTDGIVIEWEQ